MNHVNVSINGRQYRMACADDEEAQLAQLAEDLDSRIRGLRQKFGEIGDQRLEVMAALMVADELLDAHSRIQALEQEIAALRDVRIAATERARTTQVAVTAALNAAAERIERTTRVLNRTIGGGTAIG